ncbi:MAG: endolytic transglycosylase MltG [Flavobacteriales bacterium]|nr:endolytic transglycosylase MltG [Flavobacteriales bacterium]
MAKRGRIAGVSALVVLLVVGLGGCWAWKKVTGPAAVFKEESKVLYIPRGADFEQVVDSLSRIGAIQDPTAFRWLCERKNYASKVKPGRYRILNGMSMNALVNMLRSGEQEPVRVTFSTIKRLPELAGKLGRTLEPDSLAFVHALTDSEVQRKAGYSAETFIAFFVPNTYEFWWTTTPEQFIERMAMEHAAFWSTDRMTKAQALKLSPTEVSTLASIVQAETVKRVDAPKIAGVYLNRLRIGMPLQADPTLKFALGLDSISRVLHKDLEVASPYNTYRNTGLPPGPINMPETSMIDAVLNAEKHDYLYFCARADLSGYSDFAKTYEQHLVYARKYQRALNERGIMR